MTNTTTQAKAEVVKKGNNYYFILDGEDMARLGVMTLTLKNKLVKDLKKMKWYNTKDDFNRTVLEVPKSISDKNLEVFRRERDSLAMWSPVVAYIKSDDKKLIAKMFCSEFFRLPEPPIVFVDKMQSILSDFAEILEKFLNHADSN